MSVKSTYLVFPLGNLQRDPASRRLWVTQLVSLLMALMIAYKLLIVYNTLEDTDAKVFTYFSSRLGNVVH